MSTNKAFPDCVVTLTSAALVPFQIQPPLIVNDVMSATLIPGQGDGIGVSFAAMNPNAGAQWSSQTSYATAPDGLEFCRFCEDGEVKLGAKAVEEAGRSDWAGWMLQPRYAWLDAKADDDSVLDTLLTDINFESISGIWRTAPKLNPKTGTGIYNVRSGEGGYSVARSAGVIPRNRSMAFLLSFVGQESDSELMDARVAFGGAVNGDIYSIFFSHGAPISLQRLNTTSFEWERVFTFDAIPPANLQNETYLVGAMRISGRIVVAINGRAFWNIQRKEGDKHPGESGTAKDTYPVDINWGEGKVVLETNNIKCRMEFGVVKYSSAEGTPNIGTFSRNIIRPGGVPDGDVEVYTGGWKKDGTNVQITVAGGTYNCVMTANEDGIDTPFLSKVLLYLEGTYSAPSGFSLDITGAVDNIRVTQSLPTMDSNSGSEADVEIDMLRLREICRAAGIPSLSYATTYRRIDIKVRWIKEDGTAEPVYTPIFRGLTVDFKESLPGFASHTRTLKAKDYMVLLNKPAALIDQRYAPLDLFYCRKADIALSNINQQPNPSGAVLYGYECVREIIRTELGSATANAMQVVLPPSHYPLVDARNDRCGYLILEGAFGGNAAYENGFMFPPPYGECALDWIRKFQELDHAVFFMSFPEDDRTQPPTLIYARLQHWLNTSGRMTWDAPDNVYEEGDIDRVMENLELETRVDRDFNHVAAWSTPQGTDLGGILPALRISEAYTRVGRSRAPLSWRRSLLIQNPLAWVGGAGVAGVDALAQVTRNEIEGVQLLWPTTSLPGNALMAPGDKLRISRVLGDKIFGPSGGGASLNYSSPAGYNGVAELTCRIESVTHNINLSSDTAARRFVTVPGVRPLLSSEFDAGRVGGGAEGSSEDGAVEQEVF